MYQKHLLFLLINAFLFCEITSCSKKQEKPHYLIPDSLKDYSVFQKGSYWIYKLSGSNSSDTTKVFSLVSYTENSNQNYDQGPLNDIIVIRFISNILSEFYINHYGLTIDDKEGWSGASLITGLSPGQQTKTSNNLIYEYVEYLDTFSINGNSWYKVIHSKYSYQPNRINSWQLEYFICKNVGLVLYKKKMNGADSIWSLGSYHVVQ
jgi:hypothetical protein